MTFPGAKYPFLDVVSESEAAGKGINLSDKLTHLVYRNIKNLSSIENASRGILFSTGMTVAELMNVPKKELINTLRRLCNDNVVVQIVRYEFDPTNGEVRLIPHFIAQPSSEKSTVERMYNETINLSTKAFESCIDGFADADRKLIWKDLETDFKATGGVPSLAELPAIIADFFSFTDRLRFEVIPLREMLQKTKQDIYQELVLRGKIVEIPDYGVMPIHEADFLERLETAADFVTTRIIPKYRSKGNLKRELEQIALEEAYYSIDEFARTTAEFITKKAKAIKQTMISDRIRSEGGVRFPGSLAIEMVLALEKKSFSFYEVRRNREISRQVQEFRKKLNEVSRNWRENIHLVPHSDFLKLHPAVQEGIHADSEIMHGLWELPGRSIHVYIKKDLEVIQLLVDRMQELSSQEFWQVFVLRALLDQYEPFFVDLFSDPHFVQMYGKLLRKAYLSFMPLIHRILIFFGITFFQDSAFQAAKRKVMTEQQLREKENNEWYAEETRKKESERKEKLERIKDMEKVFRVVEALDGFYLGERKIPTIGEVRESMKTIDPIQFREIIAHEGFQTISVARGEKDDEILLYPMNYEWRVRSTKLSRMVDELIKEYSSRVLNEIEKIQLSRAERVRKFLLRNKATAILDKGNPAEETDAYKKLAKAIKSQQEREEQEMDAQQGEGFDELPDE